MKGMTDMLETLVKFSNKYGREHEYVLAGGGNTSCKTEDTLYIKGSGIASHSREYGQRLIPIIRLKEKRKCCQI